MELKDKKLLRKFLQNACTPEELVLVKLILQSPEADSILHDIILEESDEWWNAPEKDTPDADTIKRWRNQVVERIRQMTPGKEPVRYFRKIHMVRHAAIWIIVILAAVGYGLFRMRPESVPVAMLESRTAGEKISKVYLPDSTIVYLNKFSQLKYSSGFVGPSREVFLTGEAFFDVSRANARPFIVHAGSLDVRVLGTSFDIRSYHDEPEARITVASGKVKLLLPSAKDSNTFILSAGNRISYDLKTGRSRRTNVDPHEANAWQTGMLIFKNQTLGEISEVLHERYGVSFRIENAALSRRRYTLKATQTDLDTLLTALSRTGTGFSFKIRDKQVIIH